MNLARRSVGNSIHKIGDVMLVIEFQVEFQRCLKIVLVLGRHCQRDVGSFLLVLDFGNSANRAA